MAKVTPQKNSKTLKPNDTSSEDFANYYLLPIDVVNRFGKEFLTAMSHYTVEHQIELTDHLLLMMNEIEVYASDPENKNNYKEFEAREDTILKKYKKHFLPFYGMNFFKYCQLLTFVTETIDDEDNEDYKYPKLLTAEQIMHFTSDSKFILSQYRTRLYLLSESDFIQPIQEKISEGLDGATTDKEATQARQLLAIYYLLKVGFNIIPREKHPVSEIARIAHLLTGTKLKTLNQSEIYSKLLKMPNYKKGAELIKDLQYIRSYFDIAGLGQVRQQIDDDIASANGNLPK